MKQSVKDPFTDPSKNQNSSSRWETHERLIHIFVFGEKPIHRPITDLGISICYGSVNCERLKKDEERWRFLFCSACDCVYCVIVNRPILASHMEMERTVAPNFYIYKRVKSGVKSRFCAILPDFDPILAISEFCERFSTFSLY